MSDVPSIADAQLRFGGPPDPIRCWECGAESPKGHDAPAIWLINHAFTDHDVRVSVL